MGCRMEAEAVGVGRGWRIVIYKPSIELVGSCDAWVAAGCPWYKSNWLNWSDLAKGGSRLAVLFLRIHLLCDVP